MLREKCALVTGSVAGLGYAIAEALAAQGASVVLNGLCPAGEGEAAARALAEKHGVDVVFEGADLCNVAAIERMTAAVAERFGGVDILVNNAVIRHFALTEDLAPEQWDASLAVNLSAAFHLARLTLPHMKRRDWGRIINMSSVYGSRGAPNRVEYITTKTALIGMTRAIAIENAKTGVTCNALSPGVSPTPAILGRLEAQAAERGVPAEQVVQAYVDEKQPNGRFVALESVGAFAAFLCSPAGGDITGAVLPIDGGYTAA